MEVSLFFALLYLSLSLYHSVPIPLPPTPGGRVSHKPESPGGGGLLRPEGVDEVLPGSQSSLLVHCTKWGVF